MVVPTAVTVLMAGAGRPSFQAPQAAPAAPREGYRQSQMNFLMVLDGERKVELHKPLPAMGATFASSGGTIGAFDKGKDKGAVIVNEQVWTDEKGDKAVTITGSTFARGDGGFGGPTEGAPEPHVMPARKPDLAVEIQTRPDQALIYRLNGDRNPLHCDPEVARRAGFQRPILHGLCSYGITCRAVLKGVLDYDADRILSHQARFSAPVIPGDLMVVDIWVDGDVISFEARVPARNATVIKAGKTVLRAA
jgi:acyl dehydratase